MIKNDDGEAGAGMVILRMLERWGLRGHMSWSRAGSAASTSAGIGSDISRKQKLLIVCDAFTNISYRRDPVADFGGSSRRSVPHTSALTSNSEHGLLSDLISVRLLGWPYQWLIPIKAYWLFSTNII